MAYDNVSAYDRLKPRQRKFIDELLAGAKHVDAARAAGYGAKRPDVAAARLMRDPLVREAYDERRREIAEQAGVDAIRVVHELAIIGYDTTMPPRARIAALELLGKYLGLWTEKHELTGPNGGPISTETKVSDPVEAARMYRELMERES